MGDSVRERETLVREWKLMGDSEWWTWD